MNSRLKIYSSSNNKTLTCCGNKYERGYEDPILNSQSFHSSLYSSGCFLNRELSWINFNRRVLGEAQNPRTPLLERVKFLAIVSANIDEFYMKRLGGLKLKMAAGMTGVSVDGLTAETQLEQCRLMLLSLQQEKEEIFQSVTEELRKNEIYICNYSELNENEQTGLHNFFLTNVLPLITPLSIDQSHPFPFISNLSLNLLVAFKHHDSPGLLQARIKIPTGDNVPRFVKVGTRNRYIRLEELVIQNIDRFFPHADIIACNVFRITRNANTEQGHSSIENMFEVIASELRNRRFAPVVRVQIGPAAYPPLKRTLSNHLGLDDEKDILESAAMVCMSDLMEIAALDIPSLHYPVHSPITNIKIDNNSTLFKSIRSAESILLQHPYESFTTSVVRFVREASQDPEVAAIKMTLYRTSEDTSILEHLINAARTGKQVAVIVELKARFDEEANIRWASRLKKSGVHVSYGISGLKTHCKTILVVRKEHDGLRRYAHIGTGNYHAGTAKQYSDIGLLTCDHKLTEDVNELFNYLTTACHPRRKYLRILATPHVIKKVLLEKIQREISHQSKESQGHIRLKTNALEDPDITVALYKASIAGVKIELIVRDICRLRPGVPGLSENITVVSIVGRFLEHSRIYYFRNGGEEEYYIGSADLMSRNLERRVELLIPIENDETKYALNDVLEDQLRDNGSGWDMKSDGHYEKRRSSDKDAKPNCQESAMNRAVVRRELFKNSRQQKTQLSSKQWLRLCF